MKNQTDTKCEHCSVRHQKILKTLSDGELRIISDCKTASVIKKGEVIFEEGDVLAGVYCIKEGICKLSKLSANGKSQIVRFVGKGDILGQRSVISNDSVNLTAVALTDIKACFIPKDEVFNFFATNTDFSIEVFRNVCDELKKADNTIVDLAQKTVKQRLADTLLFLEDNFGTDEKGYINIQLSREEIGNMIGSATESLIRMLSEFSKNNWIETQVKKIKILNKKKLEKLSLGN
ncbi:MAG: Crp/Fnr family transcriptional regulator [Capnocytophaga felis]|uniref:Crp/Fnr family transcriptional regulator n=1 Tax=Capnocytophaga felis TaxID=2267611 RepID=A0A5M4BBS0_9FLAO|nr:Crp/Fnr family transcriptional regulator [Capnocytophaga felis]MDO4782827.1 Crp/Fnr family transcriptional regulator [Capnocytophaga felis]GET46705.1 Crp/Fnr family transcriptional regulator [Capnocytophaga felis]GET48806.1 Crp/Fnr family transcriptional regulator [Capnocytophaga felis]